MRGSPPQITPRPLLFHRGDCTGIESDQTTPAQGRDDIEAFLTILTPDTWLESVSPHASPIAY